MKKIITILLMLVSINSNSQSADELYKKGIEYFRNNEFQNAKNTFEQSFKLNPDFKTYGMYVMLTVSTKDFEGLYMNNLIIQYTLKLKALNKIKSSYFYNVLNDTYLQMEKTKPKPEKINNYENQLIKSNIIKNIDLRYKENPIDYSTNLNKGLSIIGFRPNLYLVKKNNSYLIITSFDRETKFYQADYDYINLTKSFFNNLVKIKPNSETGYFYRGISDIEYNIDDIKTALKINPNYVLANMLLYGIELDKEDYSGAIINLSKVFIIEPNKVIESIKIDGSELATLFLYAAYYKNISSEANSKYVNSKSIDNKFVRLFIEKKYTDAVRISSELIEENIKRTLEENIEEDFRLKKVYYFRGISNFKLNNYLEALNDFNFIIEKDSTISDAIAMRGAVKLSLNDYNGASLDLNKAIELDNSDGYMYYYRGIAKNKLGDNIGACSDLKKAIELGYDEASIQLKEICK